MKKQLMSLLALIFMTQLYGYDVQVDEQPLFKKNSEHNEHKQKHCEKKCFKHNIKLQLCDCLGFPVPDTEFWVEVDVVKDGSQVTLELPTINFQTGPQEFYFAQDLNYYYPNTFNGGYLYTVDCFLPEDVRPTDLVYRSIVGASNNGLSLPWDFNNLSSLPVPPVGYIVQVTNAGALVIQCAGTYANTIPEGPQILMPCNITYKTKPRKKLCENFIITDGFTTTTQFINPTAANVGFRDSHVNTAYNHKMAWSWSDNSMQTDKTNGTMNIMVAMGKTDRHGKVYVNAPVQLTNFPAGLQIADTAVTINPIDPKNIIVSYGLIDYTQPTIISYLTYPCRAVSFDGGKTWPAPYEYVSFIGSISGTTLTVTQTFSGTLAVGQTLVTVVAADASSGIIPYTTITGLGTVIDGIGTYMVDKSQVVNSVLMAASDPCNGPIPICTANSLGFGDCRGVSADKYGNIWYSTSNVITNTTFAPPYYQPIFAISSDKGVTFTTQYSLPLNLDPNVELYDYPQFCFGATGDGNPENNYGLHFTVDVETSAGNFYPTVGFIPIIGLGTDFIDSGTQAALTSLLNVNALAGITASTDGRIWYQGIPNASTTSYIAPLGIVFKSPGALDVNYAGPWNLSFVNGIIGYNITLQKSQPVEGYRFPGSIQSIIYDDARRALYCVLAVTNPDYSQNMRLNFIISRDNGQTWSDPLEISTTDFANRGFQSMALDQKTGDLIFGWYDGRNHPSYTSVQRFGARISAKELDEMVAEIPYSNPVYNLPSAAIVPTKAVAVDSGMQPKGDKFNNFMQKRLERKHPHLANIKDKIQKIKTKA